MSQLAKMLIIQSVVEMMPEVFCFEAHFNRK